MQEKKTLKKQLHKKFKYKLQWIGFPNLYVWNNSKQVEIPLKSISTTVGLHHLD